MAIAYDTFSASTRTATTDPYTFTHTPVGVPRGALLFACNITSSAAPYTSAVTYGGVTMTSLGITAQDTAGEPGSVTGWFLGSGLPTGGQTVSIDLTSATTDDIQFYCATFTAAADTYVVVTGNQSNDQANPNTNMGVGGVNAIAVGAIYSGLAAPTSLTINANMTAITSVDHGNNVTRFDRQTTPSTADFSWSYVAASDDVAMVVASIAEVAASVPRAPGIDSGFGHFCKAWQAARRWRHGASGILIPETVWA